MAHSPRVQNGGVNSEHQVFSKPPQEFYILPVAMEIKQIKPNIWKLYLKKINCFS